MPPCGWLLPHRSSGRAPAYHSRLPPYVKLFPLKSNRTARDASQPSLCDLEPGESARIVAVTSGNGIEQRLAEMGLTSGENVEVVRIAPLGDPIEIRIRGYHLSLRRSEAGLVHVSK
ncbi:ferrous iron transport protein A [Candidatus Sumerlaeota bacterium]|nr:ferrous iron transport protein A [Candidatus Sumerlaeota bacterium]